MIMSKSQIKLYVTEVLTSFNFKIIFSVQIFYTLSMYLIKYLNAEGHFIVETDMFSSYLYFYFILHNILNLQ